MRKTLEKNTTVLYIDDDADDLQLLEDAFSLIDPSYRMLQASSGVEGLQVLHQLHREGSLPCLVVLDINMPGMCGRETFQRIKENAAFSSIPLVIFSTSNSPKDKAFFDAPGVGYLTKPLNFTYLMEVARQLIGFCSKQAS